MPADSNDPADVRERGQHPALDADRPAQYAVEIGVESRKAQALVLVVAHQPPRRRFAPRGPARPRPPASTSPPDPISRRPGSEK